MFYQLPEANDINKAYSLISAFENAPLLHAEFSQEEPEELNRLYHASMSYIVGMAKRFGADVLRKNVLKRIVGKEVYDEVISMGKRELEDEPYPKFKDLEQMHTDSSVEAPQTRNPTSKRGKHQPQ